MTRFDSSEAIVCDHCGAPLAVRSNKIEQCDHCNAQNALQPETEKELALSKKAKESQAHILTMLNQNPSQNFPAAAILVRVSKDIPRADMGKFAGYVLACLDDMVKAGELKVGRGRSGGYQTSQNMKLLKGSRAGSFSYPRAG